MATGPLEPYYAATVYRSSVGLPSLREVDRTGTSELYWNPVIRYRNQRECEILYVMGGSGRIAVESRWHEASAHHVFFTPPGTHLDLITQEEDKLDLLYAHFHMHNDHQYRRINGPAPYVLQKIESYDEEAYPNMLCLPDFFFLGKDNLVVDELAKALEVYEAKAPGYHQETCLLVLAALHQLSSAFIKGLSDVAIGPGMRALALAKRMRSYIYARGGKLSGVGEIGEAFGMNSQHLSRVFKKTYGEGILAFANRLRVESAKHLLRTEDKSTAEVAAESGFKTTDYFRRVFRKIVGLTPSEFRALGVSDTASSGEASRGTLK